MNSDAKKFWKEFYANKATFFLKDDSKIIPDEQKIADFMKMYGIFIETILPALETEQKYEEFVKSERETYPKVKSLTDLTIVAYKFYKDAKNEKEELTPKMNAQLIEVSKAVNIAKNEVCGLAKDIKINDEKKLKEDVGKFIANEFDSRSTEAVVAILQENKEILMNAIKNNPEAKAWIEEKIKESDNFEEMLQKNFNAQELIKELKFIEYLLKNEMLIKIANISEGEVEQSNQKYEYSAKASAANLFYAGPMIGKYFTPEFCMTLGVNFVASSISAQVENLPKEVKIPDYSKTFFGVMPTISASYFVNKNFAITAFSGVSFFFKNKAEGSEARELQVNYNSCLILGLGISYKI